jgi:hypothetical protein
LSEGPRNFRTGGFFNATPGTLGIFEFGNGYIHGDTTGLNGRKSFMPHTADRWRFAHVKAILALTLAIGACASHPPDTCRPGERPAAADALYFGAAKPDGTAVTAEEWRDFVDRVVTPRFPQGLSWWEGAGQWRTAAGTIQREASHILHLVHEDTAENELALREIANRYKTRFRQEAVLRIRSGACVSF